MFPLLRHSTQRRVASQVCTSTRCLSLTGISRAPAADQEASGSQPTVDDDSSSSSAVTNKDNDTATGESAGFGASRGRGFRAWLDGDGARYRNPIKGRTNWLADTPFPLNPTFRPLPPLADSIKTKIYNAYIYNITLKKDATDSQVVRAVAAKFGVGMDRVRAVIRLKELEKSWKDQGLTLQSNLLTNMESYLGVKQPVSNENWRGQDALEDDSAKPRLASNKTLFEMVDEESGDSPVFLPLLSHLPTSIPSASPSASTSTSSSSPKSTATKSSADPAVTVVPAARPGRAATVFKDLSRTKEGDKMRESYVAGRTKRGKGRSAGQGVQ